jgi:ParB-like chromosome segregation protein Spo0J
VEKGAGLMIKLIDIPVHPAAELFPMLSGEDLTRLENDIKLNGQTTPVIMSKGMLIDGRNRYAACSRANIKVKVSEKTFADDDECIRYIISTNIHRRHLTESQRAMIAAELANLGNGEHQAASIDAAPKVTQPQAADMMQVSRISVQRARVVQQEAPDLAALVKSGEMKVSKAASIVRERAKPVATDPSQADDSVIDATDDRHASGDTPKSRSALATLAKLDPTEMSFIKPDVLKMLGV